MIGPPIATSHETDQMLLASCKTGKLFEVSEAITAEMESRAPYAMSANLRQIFYRANLHHGLWLACGRRIYVPDRPFRSACESREWVLPDLHKIIDGEPAVDAFGIRLDPVLRVNNLTITGVYVTVVAEMITMMPIMLDESVSMPIPLNSGSLLWDQSSDRYQEAHNIDDGDREMNRRLWRSVVGLLCCLRDQVVEERPMSRREIRETPSMKNLGGASVRTIRYDRAKWCTVVTRYTGDRRDLGGTHATPVEHGVREHEAIYWVRDPGGFSVEAFGVSSAGNALFAVKRPVRAHIRGSGEGGERVVNLRERKP